MNATQTLTPLPDDLIPLIKACEKLQCHPGTVQRWIAKGKLPGYRRLGRWFVSEADCAALFRKWRQKPACKPHETPEARRNHEAAEKILRERFGFKI